MTKRAWSRSGVGASIHPLHWRLNLYPCRIDDFYVSWQIDIGPFSVWIFTDIYFEKESA